VQSHAQFITASNDEHGVAIAIDAILSGNLASLTSSHHANID